MRILGIETSCDETAAAIVEDGVKIIANVVASSVEIQQKYGGVVPEVAARKQVESIIPVLTETLTTNYLPADATHQALQAGQLLTNNIDAIAVTVGPGLIGSLLIGVETAKTLALLWNKPIIPVNHIHAHIYANFITSDKNKNNELITYHLSPITFPAIALVASGGHTELFYMKNETNLKWLGGTLDDAAGECFDKVAKLLGLPYPGGPALQRAAEKFEIRNPASPAGRSKFYIKLPRPMMHDESFNFSFSGLKTAVIRELAKLKESQPFSHLTIQQFAYETQEAITDVLVSKTLKAAQQYNAKSILLGGGVAANSRLRKKFNQSLTTYHVSLSAPDSALCTDNAAAIAACAYFQNKPVDWKSITAQPNLSPEFIL